MFFSVKPNNEEKQLQSLEKWNDIFRHLFSVYFQNKQNSSLKSGSESRYHVLKKAVQIWVSCYILGNVIAMFLLMEEPERFNCLC